jgi:hypothetical protein
VKQWCSSNELFAINDKRKGCHGFLCVMKEEGKRANQRRDRERACVRGRASEEREIVASVQDQQISINTKWKCKAISRMNNVNKDITEGQKLESFKINTKQHYKYVDLIKSCKSCPSSLYEHVYAPISMSHILLKVTLLISLVSGTWAPRHSAIRRSS